MPPDILTNIWTSLISAGLPAVLLALAVRYLSAGNSVLIRELNEERKERLDTMEDHITRLQERSDGCERDRLELHKQIAVLLARSSDKNHH
jgi:hypothetical protein